MHSWPGLTPGWPTAPLTLPSLTFPLHSCMADLPPAPRWSPLLLQGGSYSPALPLCQGWQTLQQLGTLPCPCQRKKEMRAGHGRTGSWDTQSTSRALQYPCFYLPQGYVSTLSQPSLEYHAARSPALSFPRPALHKRSTCWQHPAPTPPPHCPALPVRRKERREGDSPDPESQQNTDPCSEGVTPAHSSAAALAMPRTNRIPEALLSTVLFYLK